jgi:hypothetical protein
MKYRLMAVFLGFLLVSCSGTQINQTTPTPTPTAIASLTNTPNPTVTITSTPDKVAEYMSVLPQAPSGFSWRVVPEFRLAVLVPDGWFFRQEDVFDINVAGAVYVTQEYFDGESDFSTGMAVVAYVSDDPDVFAESLLADLANADTTTRILDSWDSTPDANVVSLP